MIVQTSTRLEPNIQVAEFALVRVASSDVEWLEALISREAARIIRRIDRLRDDLGSITPNIIDILYENLNVFSSDVKLSRYALQLKRDAYNQKPLKWDKERFAQLCDRVTAEESMKLRMWQAMHQELEQLRQQLHVAAQREEQEIRTAVLKLLSSEASREWASGVALASPDLIRMMDRAEKELRHLGTNFAKSIYMYLQRGAIKTSPFSTLTQVACSFANQPGDSQVRKQQSGSYVKLNRAIVYALIEAISQSPELKDAFRYALAECATDPSGRSVRYISQKMYTDRFFWSFNKTVTENPVLTQFTERWQEDSLSHAQLEQAIESAASPVMVRKLLDSLKIARPIAPYPATEDQPLIGCAKRLRERAQEQASHLAQRLERIQSLVDSFAGLYDPVGRVEQIQAIRTEVKTCFEIIGAEPPAWIRSANVIYEDVRYGEKIPELGEYVKRDLALIHEEVKPYISISVFYEKAAALFVDRYGKDTKVRLIDYLTCLTSNEALNAMLTRSCNEPADIPLTDIRVGPSTAPANVSIYFQVAADSHEAILKGDYQLVVNKISTGSGGVFSRFKPVIQDARYDVAFGEWMRSLYPTSRPVELMIGSDWSNLQDCFGVFDERMQWLGEMRYEGEQLNPGDLYIAYHEPDQALMILDREGEVVSPVYLGTIPSFLFQGSARYITSLVNPWLVNTPYGINPRPWEKIIEDDHAVVRHPRIGKGRIVFKREQWVVPLACLPDVPPKCSEADKMLIYHDWAKQYGMPDEMFFNAIDTDGRIDGKPIWIHLKSPYSIEIFRKCIRLNIRGVVLTEALPSRSQTWFTNRSGTRLVTEFAVLGKIQ